MFFNLLNSMRSIENFNPFYLIVSPEIHLKLSIFQFFNVIFRHFITKFFYNEYNYDEQIKKKLVALMKNVTN